MFSFEDKIWETGDLALGMDEVGRGAFAGPLGVGGVIFKPNIKEIYKNSGIKIDDSKKLSKIQRNKAANWIKLNSIFHSVELISVDIINQNNINNATQIGLKNIADKASKLAEYLLIDAFSLKNHSIFTQDKQKAIIKGDSLSFSIAAASIIAKVERDAYMEKLSKEFPEYSWDENRGYGTLKHRNAILLNGISPHHRLKYCRKLI